MVEGGKWFTEIISHTRKAMDLAKQAHDEIRLAQYNRSVASKEEIKLAKSDDVYYSLNYADDAAEKTIASCKDLLLAMLRGRPTLRSSTFRNR